MTVHDPKQFILEYLSLPPNSPEPGPPPPMGSKLGGKPGQVWRGAGRAARAATGRFLKQCIIPNCQVHAVAFEDEAGLQWDYICYIVQDEQGFWHMEAAGGLSEGKMRQATQSFPWAHLVGGGWEDHFWAGGYITDNASDKERVRLISKNGQVLEDIVQNSLVLFLTDQETQAPVEVELYNRSGGLVGTQTLFQVV